MIDDTMNTTMTNLTSLLPDYNMNTTSTSSWEVVATFLFWIEGVLTPLVSLGGLIGKCYMIAA